MFKYLICSSNDFLSEFRTKFENASRKITNKYPGYDVNYLPEFSDHPASVYKKFFEPDCYISFIIDNGIILAFSMSYKYDDKTCILGSRSFVISNSGYENKAGGLIGTYCIPLQMIKQKEKFKMGMTTFNINSFTDRLWRTHSILFENEKKWLRHKKEINQLFPEYDYKRTILQKNTKIINNVEQRYSLVPL